MGKHVLSTLPKQRDNMRFLVILGAVLLILSVFALVTQVQPRNSSSLSQAESPEGSFPSLAPVTVTQPPPVVEVEAPPAVSPSRAMKTLVKVRPPRTITLTVKPKVPAQTPSVTPLAPPPPAVETSQPAAVAPTQRPPTQPCERPLCARVRG